MSTHHFLLLIYLVSFLVHMCKGVVTSLSKHKFVKKLQAEMVIVSENSITLVARGYFLPKY